jgi:enolase
LTGGVSAETLLVESSLAHDIANKVANSVLVKVNQNGLIAAAARVVELATRAGYRTIVSARSGDVEDCWLADLAVGWRIGQIKVGSTRRSERNAKWNRRSALEAIEFVEFAGPWINGRPRRNQ